ncbi:Short-chain dehydrogenase reductase tropE [Hyphodiscus hymeniophilus]|uniref:Short-chain dehydrogenase reductase tropE n=1 Tax=Hyphodiscus hymeniophilus TaxID=353542 RepID=A0A9P6VDY9_9HELO|nr:Short-chain dehydrogenase reductase tropE [Hyphodiscus hymeniophilus]
MHAKSTVFITGADRGLGFETVKALLQSSNAHTIFIGALLIRDAENAVKRAQSELPQTKSNLEAVEIDIESDESIQSAFEKVSSKCGKLDTLINNAGAQFETAQAEGRLTLREAWNKSWSVNVTGAQVLTHVFVPLLLKSTNPRVIFLTSGTSTLEETYISVYPFNHSPVKGWPKEQDPAASFPAYRSSKTGLNMMMREWERTLKHDGVKVFCCDPGFSATNLGGSPDQMKKIGAQDPAIGGAFIKDVVEGNRDQDAGKVLRIDGIQPW